MVHQPPPPRDEPPADAGQNNRVLVIEDDSSMAEIVLLALGQAGYQGTHLVSADLALQALRVRGFDAVICDINLSTTKSGIDFYIEARKLRLHFGAFLFMTGQAIDRDVLSHVEHDGSPEPVIFFKPFSVGRIINTLNEILHPAASFNRAAGAPAKAVPALTQAPAPVEHSRLSLLRHDLSNKAMIANENLGIAIMLRQREAAAAAANLGAPAAKPPVGPGRRTVEERLQTAKTALDEICALLEGWRSFEKGSES